MTEIPPEKLAYYKSRLTTEGLILRVFMRELKKDGLLWAADQISDVIGSLEEVQIEAEEPTEDDLKLINWTPGKLLDIGQIITLPDGKEYVVE